MIYLFSDRNKKRKYLIHKISQQKQRLLQEIGRYNQLPDAVAVDVDVVVQKLSSKSEDSMIWPWQEQESGLFLMENIFNYSHSCQM